MTTRTRYTATYDYPGMLFPESVTRDVADDRLESVVAAAPAETEGYFRKDGWYAFQIHAITEKHFTAEDGEEAWVRVGKAERVANMVVGEKVHVDSIPDTAENRILRVNIQANTPDGVAVKTRAGNWQLASDYDLVLSPSEASS